MLAGGLGTRLRPLTDTMPKCLVPIAGKPLAAWWFARFADAELRDVLINTHHLPEPVRAFIAEMNDRGFRVQEAYEPELLGSAGTVRANRAWMDAADECVIVYADNLSNVDLGQMLSFHREHEDPVTMMLFHTENPRACGIVELDTDGRVVAFEEKPDEPATDLANGGVYVVSADAFREMADIGGTDLAFDVLPHFVGRMHGWVWDGYHLDIGTYEALSRAEADAPALERGAAR